MRLSRGHLSLCRYANYSCVSLACACEIERLQGDWPVLMCYDADAPASSTVPAARDSPYEAELALLAGAGYTSFPIYDSECVGSIKDLNQHRVAMSVISRFRLKKRSSHKGTRSLRESRSWTGHRQAVLQKAQRRKP